MSKPAFTIVEILIAVGIISILAVLVNVDLKSVQSKSRDTSRKASVSAYHDSIEQYKAAQGTYFIYDRSNLTFDLTKVTAQPNATCNGGDTCLLSDSIIQAGAVGYKGGGWGKLTRQTGNYQTLSIADVLVKLGFLNEVRLDPRTHDFTTNVVTATGYNDFLLTLCKADSSLPLVATEVQEFALYANLENPQQTESTHASHLCGGLATPGGGGYSFQY